MTDLQKIHEKAIKQMDSIMSVHREEREQCLADRRFYSISGAQWEGSLQDQYINKPKFEINKTHLSVIRIINEYRNNRISVDFLAKDGSETDLSDTCDGLFRSDEQYSNAYEAYDNAFEEAVGGGFGAWRICTEYEDDEDPENEHQRVRIEPIFEADSCVFFDLNSKRQDKADARHCFVLHALTKEEFFEQYPDATPITRMIQNIEFDWMTSNEGYYVAEYYVKEQKKEKYYYYQYPDGTEEIITEQDMDNNPAYIETIKAMGATFDRQKDLKTHRVHKYIMGGLEILEDHGYISGRHIPIVPVFGKRFFIDNVERCVGHVRYQKDAQRLYNMQSSRLAEIAALSPIEKPIMAHEQISGLENEWADDNIKNYPYLPVNPITDSDGNIQYSGPLGYTKPPQIPPALIGLMQTLNTDMQELTGKQESGEQLGANLSGKAIELVQNRLDMQSYIYMDNMRKAMQRCGQIWLSIARNIYVEKNRKMKVMTKDDKTETIELLESAVEEETGKEYKKHDLSKANLEVYASVGPASLSRKESTIRTIVAMMQVTSDPQDLQVLSSMAMMNMEGEGIEDIRDYFRKRLVSMGAAKPTKEEEKAMAEAAQNAQPNPQDVLLQAAAKKEMALAEKATADAQNAQIDSFKKAAEIDETVADTAKTYADIDEKNRQFALNMVRERETTPLTQSEI